MLRFRGAAELALQTHCFSGRCRKLKESAASGRFCQDV